MKKMFALFLLFIISGCSTTVPVTAKFPEPPKYSAGCPKLQKINDDTKLSELANIVSINYSAYYECAVKNDAWIEWYQVQKRIFESVK